MQASAVDALPPIVHLPSSMCRKRRGSLEKMERASNGEAEKAPIARERERERQRKKEREKTVNPDTAVRHAAVGGGWDQRQVLVRTGGRGIEKLRGQAVHLLCSR